MINNCYFMHNFIWRNFYYIKFLIEKCSFSTFYLVSKNTKAHFSLKAKLLGFHWTSFWMPHGYPYQEIPFWFESQFKGLDPSRAELWRFISRSIKKTTFRRQIRKSDFNLTKNSNRWVFCPVFPGFHCILKNAYIQWIPDVPTMVKDAHFWVNGVAFCWGCRPFSERKSPKGEKRLQNTSHLRPWWQLTSIVPSLYPCESLPGFVWQ